MHFGRIWLLHSGAFYDVEKKLLAPDEMPTVLHWFKWQAYTTWMTGLALLVLLYWTGGATLMMDPGVMRLTPGQAVHLGIAFVFGGFLVYDLTWRLLGRFEPLAMGLSLVGLAGAVSGPHAPAERPRGVHPRGRAHRDLHGGQRALPTSFLRSASSLPPPRPASPRTPRTASTPSSGRSTTTT